MLRSLPQDERLRRRTLNDLRCVAAAAAAAAAVTIRRYVTISLRFDT